MLSNWLNSDATLTRDEADGVVVPAPHGVAPYQTLLFFPAAFSRRKGTLDAVAADLFAGRAASIIVQASDLPSLSAIAASTGCRVVAAATLATPNGLVHALSAPCTGRTPKALKEALDAAEIPDGRVTFHISAGYYEPRFLPDSEAAVEQINAAGGTAHLTRYVSGHSPLAFEQQFARSLAATFPADGDCVPLTAD